MLEDQLREDSPRLAAAQETWYSLSGLRERFRGTAGLANERVRLAAVEAEDRRVGRDPEVLEAEAREAQAKHEQLDAGVSEATESLEQVIAAKDEAEAAYTAEERRVAGLLRAAADQREGLARLHGQVNSLKSRATAAGEEIGRLTVARDEAELRATDAQREFSSLENTIAGLNAGESGLDEELEAAETDARRDRRAACLARRRRRRRPSASSQLSRPARKPSSSDWPARTARARCSPRPTRSAACSDRLQRC